MSAKYKLIDMSKPIIVTMESFSSLKDAKLISDDGSKFEVTLINCDTISRNRTYYPLSDVTASMQDPFFTERLTQKVLIGEAEHPFNDSSDEESIPLKRLLRVEPSRWCIRLDSYWIDGTDIKGIVQFCGPFGKYYQDLVLNHDSNLAMSIRAYTPNHIIKNDKNGKYVVKTHLMYIVTFDCVTRPGLINSRIMNPEKFKEISKNNKISITSNNSPKSSFEDYKIISYNNPIDEIKDMARSEEGANIISDIFGVNFEKTNMNIINGQNIMTVFTEEGTRLDLPLNHAVTSKIF